MRKLLRARVAVVMVLACLATACTGASDDQDPPTAEAAPQVLSDPPPNPSNSLKVPATGGSISGDGVTVTIPDGAFADETVMVHTGPPIGEVRGTFAAELFGPPVGITHTGGVKKPVTVTWTVPGLSTQQRQTLMFARWDESVHAWQPSTIEPVWSGDTVTAQVTEFSFWDWITDVGQATGEWTGTRTEPPKCSGGSMPAWVRGTVSPSENTSAAAIQVCFEPDKNERATVRVTNNRTFSQVMKADGIPKWAWTWPGPENYGVAGAVYQVGHTALDGDATYLLPPLHEQAVGVERPASPDSVMITGTAKVNAGTVFVDVTAFLMDQASIGGTTNPVLNAFLQAFYECGGGKELLADATTLNVKQILPGVVKTAAGCGTELLDPASEFGLTFEQLSRKMIASSKMGADAATMANRAVRRLASYAKILTIGQLAFYTSDQFANALVGPLTWSIRGSGKSPQIGAWTPTCSDLAKDSNALYRNLALQDQFADTTKQYWQFPDWKPAAVKAVVPLTTCSSTYRAQLATYLPTSWQDAKSATIVANQIGGSGSTTTNDPRVSVVTPFLPDGRIRMPVDTTNYTDVSSGSCFQSSITRATGIYQCGSVAAHLPACWPSGNKLYCLHGPNDATVVRIWGGSPQPKKSIPQNPTPWQIVLVDGTRCDIRLGGAWDKPPDGLSYTYSCDGNYAALLAPDNAPTVDESAATWTATAQADWGGAIQAVDIAHVIYAGAAPVAPTAQTGNACPTPEDLQAALKPAETLSPNTSGGIKCLNDWATSAYQYQNNTYPGLFHKVDARWTSISRETACPLPSPIPVALYQVCEVS